jgi:hypothetical protein
MREISATITQKQGILRIGFSYVPTQLPKARVAHRCRVFSSDTVNVTIFMHGHTVFVAGLYPQIYGLATEYAVGDVHTTPHRRPA